MPETDRSDPRAPGDRRMYLYFDYSASGALRWYVKVSRKGRRIGISGDYGTAGFDAAYEAAVAALGGVMRKRRVEPDPLQQPERRYVGADRSQRGQTRYYVQLRNGLPKIRIRAEFGSEEFDKECDVAIVSQIAIYGDTTDDVNAQKQRNEPRARLPSTPPQPHTLRWYWTLYKQSDHWLGDLSVGLDGLSDTTRLQRTGLIESLLYENGEKPFAVMTRKVIKEEMKARTPSQAGNLLSALRGMIRWMIDERYLDEDDDPTIGLRSGKAKASRESGGFLPWTEDDMALYRAKWPVGTEARLMFDILHYTFLRLGDAYRFGPPHLRQIVRKMAVQIATEKSKGNTTVTVPVHPEFAESLRAARAAGIIGAEVFTGKTTKGRVLPMNKKAWAMKFKKYAVLAGINERKKSCHGVRKARAEVAAYAECTESQMMAMFGWTDPKMPAHYIAKANREKLGIRGMDKIVAFDQSQSLDDFLQSPEENAAGTPAGNKVVTFRSNFGKKA
ncbi:MULTISPECIES: tyrosine-type recombinase/integrase [unclassified Bradyrhizobium]|uniref:tyrosine-type recombinase/integrase n=1 Tax=unclassified Bradyrhizobium TaxID=2631580 RepID=UPI0028F0A6C3|nr:MULTISPECIES: tyrosine-type recombinase/integrase [unclassified Bradyrhizobium]